MNECAICGESIGSWDDLCDDCDDKVQGHLDEHGDIEDYDDLEE